MPTSPARWSGRKPSAPTSCGLCVEFGGVLTGEHGVGIEKRDLMPEMFSEIDLNQQQRLKCAFDAQGLLNPGKVFPTLHRCAELGRVHVHGGKLAFPEIPSFEHGLRQFFNRHTPRRRGIQYSAPPIFVLAPAITGSSAFADDTTFVIVSYSRSERNLACPGRTFTFLNA